MEHGGDRVGKDAVGVRVQGVERLRHGGDLHFAGGVHILIEDEAHFLFLHLLDLVAVADVALDKAWARVQLERRERIESIWNEIEVGKQYHGTVKSLTSYGAFVDIGGVDGMVHVSELSWNRIKNPSEVVKVGDEIDVYVIALDPEKRKISLGYKTEATNPWTLFNNQFQVGDVAKVKIVKLMTFGAFAEIIPGVDGLIHISQIADRRIGKPEDVLSEGQEVDAKIIDIDQEHKRISLSIRALLAPAADEAEDAE